MRIAILSRSPRCYSTRRLREAAIARGHATKVLDTLRFGMYLEEEEPDLTYCTRRLSEYDVAIPRIGASITFYGSAVVRQFEQMGVFVLNNSTAITNSRDKLKSMQILSRHDIGIPPSAFVKDKNDVLRAIERMGGAPVVIKLLEGTQGVGVILADNMKIAEAIIETLHSTRQNVLIQKFVKESRGTDIRAFVIGDQVVASMRRRAMGTEFRSNVHRGGSTEAFELPEEYARTAVRAAQIMGLRVAGVDMLESSDGPKIMEVNSSPGLEGIEQASGVDVAGKLIEYVEQQNKFTDVDIRQRLNLASGFTVAEVLVMEQSPLANQKLQDTGLREKEIMVLSINRHGHVIPVPHKETELMPGDHLLCYGRQNELRELLPQPPKRRRRRKQAG